MDLGEHIVTPSYLVTSGHTWCNRVTTSVTTAPNITWSHLILQQAASVTPARSDTRESVSEDALGHSDHDVGGVDYDDFDEEDDDFR